MTIRFFKSPADFRKWLEKNHASYSEQWVGFYKKGSGRLSITWPESVDQALCFGWIDGIRKNIDDISYRKQAFWCIVSAKKEETKLKRLARLIEQFADGRRA